MTSQNAYITPPVFKVKRKSFHENKYSNQYLSLPAQNLEKNKS